MTGQCYLCAKYGVVERHHVYGASRRKTSEKYKAVVYLCHECHNEPPNGVHHNKLVRLALQEEMQCKLMKKYNWTIEDFIKLFGKNYT